MDDLVKIIFWGFVIFSFIWPMFKKKQPPKQTPMQRKRQTDSFETTQSSERSISKESVLVSEKSDDYDILRELENMFKGDLKIPEQQKPKEVERNDVYSSREIQDKDLDLVVDKRMQRSVEEQTPIGSRKTFDEKVSERKAFTLSQRQIRVIDSKTEAEAKQFEKVLAGLHKKSAVKNEFTRKLKSPATIKELILFSEILGKPKALRR
jgi:Zn-dependent metalloprotease